ncbi:hypothetical protein Lal_00020477 [Lupinus albus]|uniref:Putative transcription factor AP2-EREBP family n=1 Tax=Lupinus albus TaxID=3870 RepID=A0A6A5MIB6_LUPAL|nr:putative transcription factor AP2-EREBP family [Lupinus albus]KAF1871683.1 hypothetical protein Lal_00020477 [Lupinus albus]
MASTVASDSTIIHSSSANNDNNNKLYKGVRLRKWGKWVSEVRLPNSRERIWLGSYDSPLKAARAFDAALYCLRGRNANFNFPDTPFNLEKNNNVVFSAGDKSLTSQEIQEIASKFANEDPPPPPPLQRGGDMSISTSTIAATTTTTTTIAATTSVTSSCSTNICDYDGMQVEHGGDMSKMDWTFLDMLDHEYSNEVPVCSDYYGLYSNLDNVHSGEFVLPSHFEDNEQQIEGDGNLFSHQSFLWNW